MNLKFLPLLFSLTLLSSLAAAQDEYFKTADVLNDSAKAEKKLERTQPQESPLSELPFIDRLRLGGSFGLGFGTITNINLSPMAAYQITDKLAAGLGLTYMYVDSRLYSIRTRSSFYGGRAFAMFNIIPNIGIQGEFEALNVNYYSYRVGENRRTWLGSPMLGAFYSQPFNSRFIRGAHFTLLYNFNYNNQINPSVNAISPAESISPYSSPFVFRITFL